MRHTSAEAGYMELKGAVKDGDCDEVEVAGGISKERGCCNHFKVPNADTIKFSCGTCKHLISHPADHLKPRKVS